jgi:hypothetical protein
MDNYLAIPEGNPVAFYFKDRSPLPQYNIRHLDEYPDQETRPLWRGYGFYAQKWQTNDTIRLQFMSNVAPLTLKIYNCQGILAAAPLLFTQVRRNRHLPELFVYQANLALGAITPGRYWLEVEVGDPVIDTVVSDYLDIAEVWKYTSLLEYSNSFYYAGMINAIGQPNSYAPSFRIEGWLKLQPPASKDELYADQAQNRRMIYSDPYLVHRFFIGPSTGVPDWTPVKMNWILGCDSLYIDGKAFAKAEGAKLEEEEVEGHPFRGWSIDLQEQNRRDSRIFPVDPSVGGKKLLVVLNAETEGFADTTTGASSNVVSLTTVET